MNGVAVYYKNVFYVATEISSKELPENAKYIGSNDKYSLYETVENKRFKYYAI